MKLALLVVAVVALIGCGPRWVRAQPVIVPAKPGVLNQAVALVIAEGESIETKDEAAGTLVTKWTYLYHSGNTIQIRVTVTVAGDKVIVASQCQRQTPAGPLTTTSGLEPCGDLILETQQAKVQRIAAGLR
jgi:hypothetical protein